MPVQYEMPTTEKDDSPLGGTIERHPAYAQIGASRVSGGACLYGSDFRHQHYMTISIHKSELRRGLSNDWPFAREEYIEVSLSEAQWATFVSAPNQGSGVQCTLNHKDGAGVPQIPEPPNRQKQFDAEARHQMIDARRFLAKLKSLIEESKTSEKAKKEMLSSLSMADREISSSLEFVAEQFGEHMEKVTEHAKVEVNAYIQGAISRAGIAALQSMAPIALGASMDSSGPIDSTNA